ncbi:hypothetical protein BLA24_10110 [Streptomyces cinnamoneus]|uniref:Thioesterase TesA-like domain-containing protein n=2 Tax=Streptomyces cinnamoneus TaxID=53446 RepID=A0A2G1XLC2_STRCJ|nr:hypothetical protein BLA24_10110 [Streptomyces cinnamoneus]
MDGGTAPAPLFCVHPAAGISWVYSGLLRHLDHDRPVYGLQARGLSDETAAPRSVEEMAEDYLTLVRSVQPHGPYSLLGWSFGGVVAHHLAVRLQEEGEDVAALVLMDGYPSVPTGSPTEADASPGDPGTVREVFESLGHDPAAAAAPDSPLALLARGSWRRDARVHRQRADAGRLHTRRVRRERAPDRGHRREDGRLTAARGVAVPCDGNGACAPGRGAPRRTDPAPPGPAGAGHRRLVRRRTAVGRPTVATRSADRRLTS